MVEASIDEHFFPALESQAARLNTATEEANAKLATIEKRLVGLQFGLEFWCSQPLARSEAEGDFGNWKTSKETVQVLGFARVDGKWALAVKPVQLVKGFYEGDTSCPFENRFANGPVTSVLQAPRGLRIAAIGLMPIFLKELNDHIKKASEIAEQSV